MSIIQQIYNLFGYNIPIFIHINEFTNRGIIPILLKYASVAFSFANFPIFYLAAAIIIHTTILHQQKLEKNITHFFNDSFALMTRIAICYLIFCTIYVLVKFSLNMPRPYCSLNSSHFFTIANTDSERCLSSFPSAHTAFSIFVVYFLWPYLNSTLKLLAILTPITVALSRISLAMHYPSDILASTIIAPLILILSNYTLAKIRNITLFITIRQKLFEKLYKKNNVNHH